MIGGVDGVTAMQAHPLEADDPGRRGQIVRAAAAVLGRQGYDGTSLKDVAREAGVAPGLLHYYFESKQELLLEVVVVMEREMIRDWQAAVAALADELRRRVLPHGCCRLSPRPRKALLNRRPSC